MDGKIWFVGDTKSDVGTAKNAGLIGFAIPQPHTFESVIESEPDHLIDSMKDFYQYLVLLKN